LFDDEEDDDEEEEEEDPSRELKNSLISKIFILETSL
jgi:hypothetical protein